jgi:hypothetical protein
MDGNAGEHCRRLATKQPEQDNQTADRRPFSDLCVAYSEAAPRRTLHGKFIHAGHGGSSGSIVLLLSSQERTKIITFSDLCAQVVSECSGTPGTMFRLFHIAPTGHVRRSQAHEQGAVQVSQN